MATTSYFKLQLSGEPIIDALTNGTYWVLDYTRTVTWAVADAPGIDWKWNATGATLMSGVMAEVLSQYAEVADVRFQYVGWFDDLRTAPADMVLAATLFPGSFGFGASTYAWAYFPHEPTTDGQIAGLYGSSTAYPNASGDVVLNFSQYEIAKSTYLPGSNGYFALLHEVGHAVGLKHPHDDGGTPGHPTFAQLGFSAADNQILTIMSYDPATELAVWFQQFGLPAGAGYPETLMPLDVLALQSIYGPNTTTRAGDTTYELYNDDAIETFWDAGGHDVLTAAGSNFGWRIISIVSVGDENLVVAVPRDSDALTGKFYFNVESVVGSYYADEIVGTYSNNVLFGLDGQDSLTGSGGDDYIDGGPGADTAGYSGSRSAATLTSSANGWSASTAADGTDTLIDVERLQFSDISVALDTGPLESAGQTVLLLGSVLPGQLVFDPSKQVLLGAVIGLFDEGYSLRDLSGAVLRLPIWDVLTGLSAPANRDIANYLLTNVNGTAPNQAILDAATSALNNESFQGDWLAGLAASTANQIHVGLVGLLDTGLEFLPPQS